MDLQYRNATFAENVRTMTVAELKKILKEKGLKTSGNREEVLERVVGSEERPFLSARHLVLLSETVKTLKEKLVANGLKQTGKKADLIQRILDFEADQEDQIVEPDRPVVVDQDVFGEDVVEEEN